jgi:hypothetical protein
MSPSTRGRLAGLTNVARHGPGHMSLVGRMGATALDARIARDAGIPSPPDITEEEYRARLKAARTAYYIRMAERRWSKAHGGRGSARPIRHHTTPTVEEL